MSSPSRRPRVSIGLPVYNAERYLEAALRSLLQQTYTDFELIISDNASTDRTGAMCRDYAARDPRIRYTRNDTNIGGSPNHNRVFHLSRGVFFTWAAHDDLRAPEHVERCVAVLEADPDVVLCYTAIMDIDAEERPIGPPPVDIDASALRPSDRFRQLIRMEHKLEPNYGVIRSDILARTPLEGQYADCDRVLFAELGLYGRFHQLSETLFLRRRHPEQSTRVYASRHERRLWYDPSGKTRVVFPHWRQFGEYLRSIHRVPLPWVERLGCYAAMGWWLRQYGNRVWLDVGLGAKEIIRPLVPPALRRALRTARS